MAAPKTSKKLQIGLVVILFVLPDFAAAEAPWAGSGDANDPYQISDALQLNYLSQRSGDWVKCFVLTADIYIMPGFAVGPIGNFSTKFTGAFDGKGHFILGFNWSGTSGDYIGLFGYTGAGAQISNLGLTAASIIASESLYRSGLLVGWNEGTITNCYSSGSVSCSSEMDRVEGLGGLVGVNTGTITNCYSSGAVSGSSEMGSVDFLGGLVGLNQGMGSITHCYSSGAVSGTGTQVHRLGGLVGYNFASVNNSFWDTQTSGLTVSAGGTGMITADMKKQATFDPPWDFVDTWQILETLSYPYLYVGVGAEPPIEGDINGDGYVDFYDFARMANHWLE